MDTISRRRFLAASLIVAALGATRPGGVVAADERSYRLTIDGMT